MLAHIYYADSLLYTHETRTWTNPNLESIIIPVEILYSLDGQADAGIRRALAPTDGEAHNNLTDAERKH